MLRCGSLSSRVVVPSELGVPPAQVVSHRLGLDLDVGSRLVIGGPVAHAQASGNQDPLTLHDGADHVDREVTERGDRVPIGVAGESDGAYRSSDPSERSDLAELDAFRELQQLRRELDREGAISAVDESPTSTGRRAYLEAQTAELTEFLTKAGWLLDD